VKTAYGNLDPGGPERPRNVERAWILVRLYANQHHTSEIGMTLKASKQRLHVDTRV
jgi:hypothetical protein